MKIKLMYFHAQLVKRGQYMEAKIVLRLLYDKYVSIGLNNDPGFYVECELEKRFKLKPHYSHNYNRCSFTIN